MWGCFIFGCSVVGNVNRGSSGITTRPKVGRTVSIHQSSMADVGVPDDSDFEVMVTSDNEESTSPTQKPTVLPVVKKERKRGVVYLSTIPRFMNVIKLREILSEYGDIGRVFLQPGKSSKKNKPAKHFTEGWVEFESKRAAKNVAVLLNNKMIGGRKKSKFYDQTWNMKYLPRFKWVHLSERLAYEQSVHRQRLHAEIFQAKKEANYFSHKVEQSEMLRKRKFKPVADGGSADVTVTSEHQHRQAALNTARTKTKTKENEGDRNRQTFLSNLFG